MKRQLILTFAFILGSAPVFAASSGPSFKTDEERTFYAYGYKMGTNLKTLSISEGETKAITEGLRDGIAGKSEAVPTSVYLPKLGELARDRQEAKMAITKKKGLTFAEAFAKEAGVKPIPNGGFIQILKEGTGPAPTADDTVKVNYRGTSIDGTEFDSSYKRKEPTMFPLKNVIPCWTNGVAMMKVGAKAKLVCPSDSAYGDMGHPPVITGGSTLVFEIELLEIVKK